MTGRELLHLCLHQVRDQRFYFLAWVALVMVHPLVGWMHWPAPGTPRVALLAFTVLPLLRVVLMIIIVGAVVHGDSPVDERAFWRTRPIAPARMALAKWILVVVAFVLLPAAVVLAMAVSVQVPAWHWPSMLVQVLVTEGAVTGLVLVLATRTRHTATLLIATTAVGGIFVLLLNTLEQLRRVPWLRERDLMADPKMATGATLAIAAIAAAALVLVAYRGHAARRTFAVGLLMAVVGLVAPWFAPALRATRPAPFPVGIDISNATVRAEQLGPRDTRVGLLVEPRIVRLGHTDTAQVFLLDGQLHTPQGAREARQPRDPRHVAASVDRPKAPLVAVLDAATFASLTGRPVRFEGRFNVDVRREDTVATAPLEVGRTLGSDVSQLRLDDVNPPPSLSGWQAMATGMRVRMQGLTSSSGIEEYRLRDEQIGCVARAHDQILMPFQADVVLPTLVRPFSAYRVVLLVPPGSCRPVPTRTVIEMRRIDSRSPTAVPVAFSFVVPATAEPPRVTVVPPSR